MPLSATYLSTYQARLERRLLTVLLLSYLLTLSSCFRKLRFSSISLTAWLSEEPVMTYLFIQIAVAHVVLILPDLPALFASIDHRLLLECLEQLVGLPGFVSGVCHGCSSAFSFCCCQ